MINMFLVPINIIYVIYEQNNTFFDILDYKRTKLVLIVNIIWVFNCLQKI